MIEFINPFTNSEFVPGSYQLPLFLKQDIQACILMPEPENLFKNGTNVPETLFLSVIINKSVIPAFFSAETLTVFNTPGPLFIQ